MKTIQILVLILVVAAAANAAVTKTVQKLALGDSEITVNVYENAGANVTFFSPHHNEQTGLNLAKDFVARSGGRLVEIESFDDKGNPVRNLKFNYGGKSYTIDPNRVYTENGRACNVAAEVQPVVKLFADRLLQLIFAPDGKTLRAGEQFIVAVHNNTDVSAKTGAAQTADLTAVAFIKGQSTNNLIHGAFEAQADGVFLSNLETDEDNFVFLSRPAEIGYFAEKGFNVVVQKPASRLESKLCSVDDGSLSVYSSQSSVPYICLEADGVSGYARQRQMFDAVYGLLPPAPKPLDGASVAAGK
ncbi:MAG: hypothetical protein JSS81_05415 [Acidobacteria bacterium]|nr:hypothetical protein [Acidobacteriota bacterium]